ncbi:hypothetical protein Ade02nite_60250 [Paractinoplanes deccanensis]|uniref:Uncharacterized protein n=1 Tax=Paractinoplanes deccanensis TaxID=113561 RepID=A0ABQ3YBM0_9ACTN|nr:hypothetical protein Ade02nite_60250 [Actinoplanes deccanensis]
MVKNTARWPPIEPGPSVATSTVRGIETMCRTRLCVCRHFGVEEDKRRLIAANGSEQNADY